MASGSLDRGHIVTVHDGEDGVIALGDGHLDIFKVAPFGGGIGEQRTLG